MDTPRFTLAIPDINICVVVRQVSRYHKTFTIHRELQLALRDGPLILLFLDDFMCAERPSRLRTRNQAFPENRIGMDLVGKCDFTNRSRPQAVDVYLILAREGDELVIARHDQTYSEVAAWRVNCRRSVGSAAVSIKNEELVMLKLY